MEQWQIDYIQSMIKESLELANSETRSGAFYTGRAQALQAVLDLIAGEEGGL